MNDPETEREALAALSIDDSLPALARLEKYAASDIALQRLFQVKGLPECLRSCSPDDVRVKVVPRVVALGADREAAVRLAVAEQVPNVVDVLVKDKKGYQQALDELVPVLTALVVDPENQEVRLAAESGLIKVSSKFSHEHVGSHILTSVLLLAHDIEHDMHRAIATKLLGMLAPALGNELCQSYVVAEIVSLSDDDDLNVRKTAIANLPFICKAAGHQLTTQRLLPLFERMARDNVWQVRKSCAESLVMMSESLPHELRCKRLRACLDQFLEDNSRWVRFVALGVLGPFISTLPRDDISPDLLQLFTEMADRESPNADSDTAFACAFNFPAVVQAVGQERWDELEAAYSSLACDPRWKVRRSIATSMHVVASMVGEHHTEAILLPVLDDFLKDIDEVRFPAVQNLCEVLAAAGPQARLPYLDVLASLRAETDNWRFRLELAKQLATTARLFAIDVVTDVLLPLALAMCKDPFAHVRLTACDSLGSLVKRVLDDLEEPQAENALGLVAALADDPSHHIRLTAAHACGCIATAASPDAFAKYFVPVLVSLATDPVPNVRLAVVRELLRLESDRGLWKDARVQAALSDLAHDEDRDVQFLAARSKPDIEPPFYNGRKRPQKKPQQPPKPQGPQSTPPTPSHSQQQNPSAHLVDLASVPMAPEGASMPGTPRNVASGGK